MLAGDHARRACGSPATPRKSHSLRAPGSRFAATSGRAQPIWVRATLIAHCREGQRFRPRSLACLTSFDVDVGAVAGVEPGELSDLGVDGDQLVAAAELFLSFGGRLR